LTLICEGVVLAFTFQFVLAPLSVTRWGENTKRSKGVRVRVERKT
jgi:hypothetical protein